MLSVFLPSFLRSSSVCAEAPAPSSNELTSAPAKARVFIASSRDRRRATARRTIGYLFCVAGEAELARMQIANGSSVVPSVTGGQRPSPHGWIDHRCRLNPPSRPVGRRPTGSPCAGGELLLLDREDLAGFHLQIAHDAGAPADIDELRVVAAGGHAGDRQALVRIDGAVLVILALVRAPIGRAGGRQIEFGN